MIRLYKYFSVPKKEFYSSKEQKKISDFLFMDSSCTPPKFFNDPFDSYIYFDSADNNYLKQVFPEQFQKGYFSNGVTRDILNEIFKINNPHDIPDMFLAKKDPKGIIKRCFPDGTSARLCLNTVRQLQVSCFSSKCDNMLMWSHYSSDHSGICIGIDLDEKEFGSVLQKVEYTTQIPEKIPYKIIDESNESFIRYLLQKQITTKSIDWIYEDEYRLITFFEPMGTKCFPVPAVPTLPKIDKFPASGFKSYEIKEVILGYRCKNDDDIFNMIKYSVCCHVARMVSDVNKKRPSDNEIDNIIDESIKNISVYRITGINKDYSLNREKVEYPSKLFKRPFLDYEFYRKFCS